MHKPRLIITLALFFGAVRFGGAADGPPWGEAVVIDRVPLKARLQSLDANGMIGWQLPNGEVKKSPLADLGWWGEWAETWPQTQVVLVDGSQIVAEVIAIDK
jgi:hypothetical protein